MLTRRQRLFLAAPFLGLVTVGVVGPLVMGLLATFTTFAPGVATPSFVGLANYARLLRDPDFLASARNVAVLATIGAGLQLVLGLGLALLLRRPFRGRQIVRVLLLVPWLVSPIASGVMWHFLLGTPGGLLDFVETALGPTRIPSPAGVPALALPTVGLIEAWRMVPLAAFLLLPSVEGIPASRWENARLDGAGLLTTIRHVAIPPARPVLAAVYLLLVGTALGTFDSVLILTGGGPGSSTLTPGLYAYQHALQSNDWALGAAAAWCVVVGVAVVGLGYARTLRGMSGPT